MTKHRMGTILAGTWVHIQKPYYQGVAAELAFFFLISIIPLFIVLAELLGIFSISADMLRDWIETYVDDELVQSVLGFFDYTSSGTTNVIFLLFALWAASKAQFSLIRIANYTYTGRTVGNGYFRERLRSILTVLLPLLLLIFAFLVLFYGGAAAGVLDFYAGRLLHAEASFLQRLWSLLRWPLAIAVYFAAISLIYYLLPTKRWKFREELPGAVLASAGMLLVTGCYSFYLTHFSNYDVLYGSLAAVVGLIMWFYFLGFVLVIGIVFNAVVKEVGDIDLQRK